MTCGATSNIKHQTSNSLSCILPVHLRPMKILMVCLGNICRSPLAEGILKHKAKAAGLNWTVESAGTNGYHVGSTTPAFAKSGPAQWHQHLRATCPAVCKR